MADVAVRAIGTPVTGTGTTLTPTIPSGTQDGDLMVAFCFGRNYASPLSETGWSNILAPTWQTNNYAVFMYRFKQSGDGNPIFDFGNAGSETVCAFIISFYNVNTTTPLDVSGTYAGDFSAPGSPYDVTLTGFNTNTDGAYAIYGWVSLDDNGWAYQSGGGAGLVSKDATDNTDMSICVAGESIPTAGGTGNQVARQTTKAGDAGGLFYFALKPAVTAINIGTGGTFAQAGKVTEDLSASVSAQTALAPSISESAKVTEALGTLVLPPDIAISAPVDTVKGMEALTGSVSTAVVLTTDKTETVRLSEDLTAALSTPVVLTTDKTETVKLTEVLGTSVTTQTTLAIDKSESIKVSEVLAGTVEEQQEIEIEAVAQSSRLTESLTGIVATQVDVDINLTDPFRVIDTITTEIEAASVQPLLIQIEQAAHFTEWFSPDFKEIVSVSDSLGVEVEALIGDIDVSTPVQTARVSEEITAVVVAQTALGASATQTGKVTEDLSISVAAQVDVNAGATQTAKVSETLAAAVGTPITLAVDKTEAIKLTEVLSGAISTPATLAIDKANAAKITEVLGGSVTAQATLVVDKTETVKVTENLAGAVTAQTALALGTTDSAKLTEVLASQISAPITLETNIADTVRVIEVRTVEVEGMSASLEVIVAEVVRTSDVTATEIIAQIAVELAAVDSVAMVTTDLTVMVEEITVTAGRRFIRIPGRGCIRLGSGLTSIPGDIPVDTPHIIEN